jgi:hypothetical protein
MPRWIIEGLATYEESKRSSTGRARSNQFDMFVRAAVLAHEEIDLDAVTNGPYEFPRGNAAYLYGGKFMQYIFDREGDDKARRMSHAGGNHTIPYATNRQIYRATGHTFDELWDDWNVYLRDKYTTQLEAVERAGVREGRRLTFDTDGHISAQYSRDGTLLYWLADDGVSRDRIRAMPVGGNVGDAHDIVDSDRFGGFCVLSDGSIVYEQTQSFRQEYDFQDLLYRDLDGDIVRLTRGLRARDPDVSHDEKRIAFYINAASHSKLAVMPLERDGSWEVIFEGGARDMVYQPNWSPDDRRIVFSLREGADRDIAVIDVTSRAVTRITDDRAIDGDPMWSPDGKTIYFSSDRTGIYNIYAHDLETGTLWQVTNVIGGAFDPAISPDGTRLAYHGFDAGGYDMYEIAIDRAHWTLARPYVDERPDPTVILDSPSPPQRRRYRPLETIGPHVYELDYQLDTSIGHQITLRTRGGDAANLHSWNLAATLGLDDGDLNLGAAYGYSGFRYPFRVSANRTVAERQGYRVDELTMPYKEETLSATVSLGIPTRRPTRGSFSLSIDFDADLRRLIETPDLDPMPGEPIPRAPTSGYFQDGFALRGSWQYTRGYSETLGQTEGQELSASIRYDDPALGATFRTLNLSWAYRAYVKLPWGQTPVLSVRYAGGIRSGDVDRGAAFTLGSTPDQDVASSILGTARVSGSGYLRGYPQGVVDGDTYQLLNLEYRHRLWQIEKGLSTLPIYLRRLHVAVLGDAGTAYDGQFQADHVLVSAGGALRLDVVIGYFAPGSFEVGYARGFSNDGIDETWFLLTTTL